MDAKDDNADIKLYRASRDLLPELCTKIPRLVWSRYHDASSRTYRSWVLFSKTEELVHLVSYSRTLQAAGG